MNRKVFITIFSFLYITLFLSVVPLRADVSIVDRSSWGADESLSNQNNNKYLQVNNIHIVKISPPLDDKGMNTINWVRGLYYYFTAMQKFSDIPFNYLVGWDGNVYQGKAGGQDVQVESSEEVGTIVIGYLAENKDDEMNGLAFKSMQNLVSSLSSKYHVPPYAIISSKFTLLNSRKDELKLSGNDDNNWNKNIENLKEALGYNPNNVNNVLGVTSQDIKIPHSVNILSVSLSKNQFQKGEQISVSISFKNTGDMNIYSPIDVVAQNSAMQDKNWVTGTIASDKYIPRILNGETRNISFQITVPQSIQDWKQSFYLTSNTDKIDNSDFTIDLNNINK